MSFRRPRHHRRCFDFEIGHLLKSPCKECFAYYRFPVCLESCAILDRIQTRLARAVLTSCSHAPAEAFAVQIENGRKP